MVNKQALKQVFGVATFGDNAYRNAVEQFQSKHGLVADGIVGKQTLAKASEELAKLETKPYDLAKFFSGYRKAFPVKSLTNEQVTSIESLLTKGKHMPISHQAYLLATAYHETAHTMLPIAEYGSNAYLAKYDTGHLAKALGNTPQADGDGQRYKGRGFVQLTGLANYRKASTKLGIDLVSNPELAMQPDVAASIAVIGMTEGWFTGKSNDSYMSYVSADYLNARRIINGIDKAKLIEGYAYKFDELLRGALK